MTVSHALPLTYYTQLGDLGAAVFQVTIRIETKPPGAASLHIGTALVEAYANPVASSNPLHSRGDRRDGSHPPVHRLESGPDIPQAAPGLCS